jgi:hypothetical protein
VITVTLSPGPIDQNQDQYKGGRKTGKGRKVEKKEIRKEDKNEKQKKDQKLKIRENRKQLFLGAK